MAEQGDQSGKGDFTFPYGFNGNKTVILVHYFDNNTLRVDPDNEENLDFKGGSGKFATWDVELDGQTDDGKHIVKFKSTKTGKYLRIWRGGKEINVGGGGGKLTRFKVYKQESDNSYKFESVNFERRYPAIQNGPKVAIGNGGKFTEFTLWSNEEDGPYTPPKDDKENKEEMEQQDQSGSGKFTFPYLLNGEQTVILKHYFGQTLRVQPNNQQNLDFKGGHGKFATWTVELDGEEDECKVIKLKSTLTGKYLRIWKGGNEANVGGTGGKLTRFRAKKQEKENSYKLESINFKGKYPAVQPKGCAVGTGGKYTEFTIWCNEEDVDQAELQKQKEEEEAKRKAEEEEAARIKAEEEAEAARKKAEEEEEARKKEEEEERLKAEKEAEEARLKAEEEARLKAEEEARIKAEEEEAARKKAEEEEAARKQAEEEEAQRKAEEEEAARKKAEEEEAARKKAEEEEAQRKAEEEEERRKQEEEEAAKQAAYEEEQKKKAEEEEAQRKAEEEAAEKKRLEEEEAARKAEEEAAAKKAEEEAAEKKRLEEEEAARKAEEEAAAKKAEEEAAEKKRLEEEEAARKAEEEAAAKKAEEEEAERKRQEEEAAKKAEEEAAAKKAEEEEAAKKAAEEEEQSKLNIEVGMKFEKDSLFYSVQSIDDTSVKCLQLEDTANEEYPNETVLEKEQFENVTILSDEEYETRKSEYNAKKEEEAKEEPPKEEPPKEEPPKEEQAQEEEEAPKEEINIDIGAKFQMGSVYYSVESTDKYVKCTQIADLKNDEFPDEIILENNQFKFVKVLTDEDYQTAVAQYKPKEKEEEEEQVEEEKKVDSYSILSQGLNTFSVKYIFDNDEQTVIIKHNQGKTLRINPDDESKLCDKGGSGGLAQWIVEFDGGDKYQRITLKNTKTNKYLRLIDDGKDVDVSGEKDDDNNFFNAITNEEDSKNIIKLESCQFKGKFIAMDSEKGVIVIDDDNENAKFAFYMELSVQIGIKFTMGGISYEVEAVEDYVKCKQTSDDKEFPEIIYLEKNQLNYVTITEMPKKSKIDVPKEDKAPKSPSHSARDKIAMFNKKPEDKPKKDNKPPPKKLKTGKLNAAKFAGLNINPHAMKPGGGGRAKVLSSSKEGGELDERPKIEQATITKGKRKRRKKKKVLIDEEETKEEKVVAPQLFYDEKAAAKSRKEKEKQYKAEAKANKKSGQTASKAKGGGGKTAGAAKGGDAGNGDGPAPQQQGGGGCCVVL